MSNPNQGKPKEIHAQTQHKPSKEKEKKNLVIQRKTEYLWISHQKSWRPGKEEKICLKYYKNCPPRILNHAIIMSRNEHKITVFSDKGKRIESIAVRTALKELLKETLHKKEMISERNLQYQQWRKSNSNGEYWGK